MDWNVIDWKVLVSLLGLLLAAATGYIKFREGSVNYSAKQMDRFYRLVSSEKWRTAHGAVLQVAVKQAFGEHLDDREIRFLLNWHNPIGLLQDRFRASDSVSFKKSSDGYEDTRWLKRIPIKFWFSVYIVFAALMFLVTAGLIILVYRTSSQFTPSIGLAILETIWFCWLSLRAIAKVGAARRLLNTERFQRADSIRHSAAKKSKPKIA